MLKKNNKIYFIFLPLLFFSILQHAKPWLEHLSDKAPLLFEQCSIIQEQHAHYASHEALSIASTIIKAIPIIENNDPLVDVRLLDNPRIQMMPDPSGKPFESPECNSGLPSASKIRKDVYQRLSKMITYLDELAEWFGYQPGDISIRVFEGLRDLKTQEYLFNKKVDEIKELYPHLTLLEAEAEASKWISPVKNNIPVHSTGAAVDIRLWDERIQDFLDMGPFGAIWGENQQAPTYSETITDVQKLHRLMLLIAATKAGLVNYSYEFWHFSYGDRYAAFWLEKDNAKRLACYAAVNY